MTSAIFPSPTMWGTKNAESGEQNVRKMYTKYRNV